MSKDGFVKLSGKALEAMNVSRDAATDGLRRLEADGLVSVQRAKGKRPVVHIIRSKA
jgi:DNA-binding FadR family transcriptional regulator